MKRRHALSAVVWSCSIAEGFRHGPVVGRARLRAPSAKADVPNGRQRGAPLRESAEAEEFDGWEAGDVYGDLERLERAIKIHEAPDSLKRSQMNFTMSHLSQMDRPLFPDLAKYVLGPLTASLLLAVLCKASPPVRRLYDACSLVYRAHFWVAVVAAPLILYCARKKVERARTKSYLLRHPFKSISDFLRQSGHVDDPRLSTADATLCLSEQVSSAVLGTALATAFISPSRRPTIHFLTRLAALVAWHQFPDNLFDLIRGDQARPLTLAVHATQRLHKLQGTTPWCLVPALARILIPWSYRSIGRLFLWMSATIIAIRLYPRLLSCDTKALPICLAALGIGYVCVTVLSRYDLLSFYAAMENLPRGIGLQAPWMIAAMPPLVHLVAFRNMFYVDNSNDTIPPLDIANVDASFPLQDSEVFREFIAEPDRKASWRWGFEWRDPRRIASVIDEFIEDLLRFSLETKFDIEWRQSMEEAQWAHLASLGADEPELDHPSLWVAQAMDQIKEKHAKDYEAGNFEDPLGVAVYRTLGIGLRFNFDHMKPVKRGKRISMRRLQARAAKSAIRKAMELKDPDILRKATATVNDPELRQKLTDELQREADREITYLANRLSELIPHASDYDDDEDHNEEILRAQLVRVVKQIRPNRLPSVENLLS